MSLYRHRAEVTTKW